MRILLTGFEPFGGYSVNPSQLLVEELASSDPGLEIYTWVLPVKGKRVGEELKDALEEFKPQLVLSFGLAYNRPAISLERVAINLLDFSIPDNEGWKPEETPIVAEGPLAYFSGLPLKELQQVLREEGIPCEISNTAGTYVCNQTFYLLAHYSRNWRDFIGGFIHLPCTPELVAQLEKVAPSFPLDLMLKGARKILNYMSAHFK
ncbi:MAG: pyroglutamyl-peptidase I [bacterium]